MPIHPHTFDHAGDLFLMAGPSATGKTTIIKRLLRANPTLAESVSYSTRWPPRPGEIMHRDYHLIDNERFLWMTVTDQFIETTYFEGSGFYYGTSAHELESHWVRGGSVIIAVDTHGVDNFQALGLEPKTVFLDCTDEDELRRRMNNDDRKEVYEKIERRIVKSREEREWAKQAYADDRVLYVADMSIEDSLHHTAAYFGLKAA
jgi:guanylate kinase